MVFSSATVATHLQNQLPHIDINTTYFFFLYPVNNLAGVIAATQSKLGPGSPQMSSKFLREFSAFWYFGHGTPGHYNKLSI